MREGFKAALSEVWLSRNKGIGRRNCEMGA